MPLGLLHSAASGGLRPIQLTITAVAVGAVIIQPSSVELRVNDALGLRPFGRIEAQGSAAGLARGCLRQSLAPFPEAAARAFDTGRPFCALNGPNEVSFLHWCAAGFPLWICWIIPRTRSQCLVCGLCPASAAARTLSRATPAADIPCTSIISRASNWPSSPSAVAVTSELIEMPEPL